VTNFAYASDRRLLAQNPDTSAEVLEELARDPDRIIQAGVAKHPHASVSALNRLALSQHWQVRMAVIGNPNTGVQALQYLAEIGPSFSQTTRARHQLFRRGAERLPYQEALGLRAGLESAVPSEPAATTQLAGQGTERGRPVGNPAAEVRTRMSKHLDECARCSADQPCAEWDRLFARYQAAGVEPGQVRRSMQEHLEDCELCSGDLPCPEWDELFAKFEAVGGHVDDVELSETPQPTAAANVAGSRESNVVPEVLSTGTVFQLLESATAYEVRAVDRAAGIPTSRYPRDPEGRQAALAHFSRLENVVPAQRPQGPAGEPSAAETRPMTWRGGTEGGESEAPPPVPVAAAAPLPNAAIAPPSSPPAQPPTTAESPGHLRRRRWIAGGLLTSLAGVCVLLIPFIPESNTTLSYSVSAGQGVCSSGLGQFAQALSASAGQSCGEIALGFYVAWAAILCGIGAAIYGLTVS
jgi:hypothetical protein